MGTFKRFLVETSEFERLKDNKKPLTNQERQRVIDKKATWKMGNQNKRTPAVWKSVDSNGKTTYVTATHRAYNTASTLDGAIKRFHDFIKGTA